LLLAKDSPLTPCITKAVDAITADGSLAAIEEKWLTSGAGVSVLN
jgi:polar amino acid transport system substrate-binding protein